MSDLSFAGLFNAAAGSTVVEPVAATHAIMRDAALAYAAKGWAAFPCKAGGKAPATQHGYKDASTSPQRVRAMFSNPKLNIGIATGDVSGVFVLDIDPRNGGDATLAALLAEHGPLPDTYKVKTGGGGLHYYFTKPPGMKLAGMLGTGLDVKADGGYVIAPPSRTTGAYTIESDAPVVEAPDWMIEQLTQACTAQPATRSPLPGALPDALRGLSGAANADLTTGIGPDWSEAPENGAQVRDMLAVLPADERALWLDICMAVKSLNWSCGEALAREWSKKSAKYSAAGFDQLWGSISPDGGTTIGTLIHHAKAAGWTAPRPAPTDASSSVQSGSPVMGPPSIEALAALPKGALAATLAKMERFDYDRVRAPLAEKLGVRVSTLDDEVVAARGDEGDGGAGKAITFARVEPWPMPVNGAALLTEISETIRRYIVCDAEAADAGALWIVMTYLMDMVQVAPLLLITAPEKRCGKTQLLSLVSRLSARPLPTSSITVAALFRAVEQYSPTLLIDEADAFMRDNEELRGIVNSGHTRDTATVIRTVGEDHEPRAFSTWCAKAIAGIGRLHGTIMDRAVVLPLRRKKVSEKVVSLRRADRDVFEQLRRRIARWVADTAAWATRFDPPDLDGLDDRALDNWEPLRQIAQAAGGDWPERTARAALTLSGTEADAGNEGRGVELLAAIRQVFEQRQANGHARADRIPSADLCAMLVADEEAPWATYNRGKPITANQIAKRLGEFGVSSVGINMGGEKRLKGYKREQFAECWARYLPPPTGHEGKDSTTALDATPSPTPAPIEPGHMDDFLDKFPDDARRKRRRS